MLELSRVVTFLCSAFFNHVFIFKLCTKSIQARRKEATQGTSLVLNCASFIEKYSLHLIV